MRHEIVKKLQQRLMDLGFMDNDEPTDYFGQVTLTAVKHFQRQNELPQDGIVGNTTWDELMQKMPNIMQYLREHRAMISRRSSSDCMSWDIWLLQTR